MYFTKALRLSFDMSKDIPKEVRRLFGISFTPILPVDDGESEPGFVTHDPFQITYISFTLTCHLERNLLEERPSHISSDVDLIIPYSLDQFLQILSKVLLP